MKEHAVFPASIDELHSVLEWIRSHLSGLSISASILRKIELACEEAIVNIIHHGYKERPGTIDVYIFIDPQRFVEIELHDRGSPFDPTKRGLSLDLQSPLEEREVGGLGLHFMRQCLDEIRYVRKQNTNILTLVKKI